MGFSEAAEADSGDRPVLPMNGGCGGWGATEGTEAAGRDQHGGAGTRRYAEDNNSPVPSAGSVPQALRADADRMCSMAPASLRTLPSSADGSTLVKHNRNCESPAGSG